MADRIYPANSPSPSAPTILQGNPATTPGKPDPTFPEKLAHPPETYVVQVPKDQVYRIPSPENASRFSRYQKSIRRKNCCCRCLAWSFCVLILLLVIIVIAGAVFYLVVRPKTPKYSVESIAIKGFNLKNQNLTISPEFDVTVRADNPNKKIGIYYERGSDVTVSYTGVQLCNGALPAFYQGSRNVTIFQTVLIGSEIHLSSALHTALVAEQNQGQVPLLVALDVPVKIKVGAIKTWKITVKVRCDVNVDKLTSDSRIVSKKCKVKVNL